MTSSPSSSPETLEQLLARAGDARYVLLGEAPHGTAGPHRRRMSHAEPQRKEELPMLFRDHRHAGQELAARLLELSAGGDITAPVVLALPRGGVPVAAEVAHAFGAPLDVLVVRKIGVPGHPETGVGAVAGDEPPVYDRRALDVLGLTEEELAADAERERAELQRREDLYRRGMPAPVVEGRSVIVVDDGLATGVTARAALRSLRAGNPARLILAVPVCAPRSAQALQREADDLVCLHQPDSFHAVGEWYEEFAQVTDDEVVSTLRGFGSSSGHGH